MLAPTSRLRRVLRTGATLGCAAAVAWTCGSCGSPTQKRYADYCAIMADSVGVYVGNPVTQMGYPIGEVTAITPALSNVRVAFKVISNRPLPADVRAVTRSPSILADRVLELVGNYHSGPQLSGGACIPLSRSSTPRSLSQIVGATTNLLNAITPADSTNVAGVVANLDGGLRNHGPQINDLLTTSSAVLDAPDQAISDIRSTITNLVELTSTLREIRGPLKNALLATYDTTADVTAAVHGGTVINASTSPFIRLASDLEVNLGDEFQAIYNDLEYALRKMSAHAPLFASLLKPLPVAINWLENHVNDKQFFTVRYRPPLYRIATPVDGLITCGAMNATSPGSCTDVAGEPYAVEVGLLQYVLAKAAHQ
jgi:phospholipid/cholesterol/gamma-HCH transport system substrate-binding protein